MNSADAPARDRVLFVVLRVTGMLAVYAPVAEKRGLIVRLKTKSARYGQRVARREQELREAEAQELREAEATYAARNTGEAERAAKRRHAAHRDVRAAVRCLHRARQRAEATENRREALIAFTAALDGDGRRPETTVPAPVLCPEPGRVLGAITDHE